MGRSGFDPRSLDDSFPLSESERYPSRAIELSRSLAFLLAGVGRFNSTTPEDQRAHDGRQGARHSFGAAKPSFWDRWPERIMYQPVSALPVDNRLSIEVLAKPPTLLLRSASLSLNSTEEEAHLQKLFGAETAGRLGFDSISLPEGLPITIEEAKRVTFSRSVPRLCTFRCALHTSLHVRSSFESLEKFSNLYHYSFRRPMGSENQYMRRSDMSRHPPHRGILTVRSP